jgi:hypothetical protein
MQKPNAVADKEKSAKRDEAWEAGDLASGQRRKANFYGQANMRLFVYMLLLFLFTQIYKHI